MGVQKEESLLNQFQSNPGEAFPEVFKTYYSLVCDQIYRVLGNPREVEDIAQEVFFELYQKRNRLTINSSLGAYLKRMAHTRTLNHIRDKKMKWKEDETILLQVSDPDPAIDQKLEVGELDEFMTNAIDQLPAKCRIIFGLKRFEGLSNRAIAEKLDISIKTVENQMTTALKRLKSALSHYKQME